MAGRKSCYPYRLILYHNIFIMSLVSDAQQQIHTAFTYVKDRFDYRLLEKVSALDHLHKRDISITMDDWSSKTFTAYRAQHTNVRWPYKGWIRRHQDVSEDEVSALAIRMSIKTAVVNLPLGWGKWWIVVDPSTLSENEKEKLARSYMQAFYQIFWAHRDVPAPDVNTNSQTMGWMFDEYTKLTGIWEPGTITGKPLSIGGSQWRVDATGRGGVITLDTYLRHHNKEIAWTTIAVQWTGNVWLHFARLAAEEGAKIIALSDISGWIYSEAWIDMNEIVTIKEKNINFADYDFPAYTRISNDELLEISVDVLVPAALENQITKDNADKIQTSLVLEMANGPISNEWAELLEQRNIPVIPDVLANSWGVTVSYFEQVQNSMMYYWPEIEVHTKLKEIMELATKEVILMSERHQVTLKNAAYIVALERILQAMKDRGR